jgi:aminopeptidase N
MSPKTVYLKNYQPYPFEIIQLALNFDLQEAHTRVTSTMTVRRVGVGPLCLYGDDLQLESVKVNEQCLSEQDYHFIEQDLVINQCPDEASIEIVTLIDPDKNSHLSGLYRTNRLYCTQCEAEGFRRITYFPDRPDVLTQYRVRIEADRKAYPVLLSNGNLVASGDAMHGRHWVIWEDPFHKPSYLFALVAGNLACVADEFLTQSGRQVDLRIYTEPGLEQQCTHAMESLKHAMRWDEIHYGREYDLDIYMIVAVSDFNMGAMENKGLNIFNVKYILASRETATDADFANVEGVVAHEYFHNWTGNRVTCRDWFQLSLKEGLTVFRDQSFSQDQYNAEVKRIEDVKIMRSVQFAEDASPMSHPVQPDSYEEINNFYTATIYNKGAEVIRMQHTLLGAEGFRRGMDLYFSRHDGHAVTIEDFVAAMEDANSTDLKQFRRWYKQAGTPVMHVVQDKNAPCLTLSVRQECVPGCADAPQAQPFDIPVRMAAFSQEGTCYPGSEQLVRVNESEQTLTFESIPADAVVSWLRDFSAPVQVHFAQTDEERLVLMRCETDGVAKWDAVQQLVLKHLLSMIDEPTKPRDLKGLLAAYETILLDHSLDQAFKAELLLPPSFETLLNQCSSVDVDAVEQARKSLIEKLAHTHTSLLLDGVTTLWSAETHQMQPQDFARRRLRQVYLKLLCQAEVQAGWDALLAQAKHYQTMSDEFNALILCSGSQKPSVREEAIQRFYTRWQHDSLVLDKWFMAQSSADHPHVLAQVQTLLSHPKFSLHQPNKVRALIGGFVHANPRQFHVRSGEGYTFLADMIVQLDAINPQIAARLVAPLIRFKKFESVRAHLMHAELERLVQHSLSKDVSEVVEKSLM